MTELDGFYGPEAQVILDELHDEIDLDQKIIKETHEFKTKLLSLDLVFVHVEMSGEYPEEYEEFLALVKEIIAQWSHYLDENHVKEFHLAAEEQAIEKRGKVWIIRHEEIVKRELEKDKQFHQDVIEKNLEFIAKIRKIFDQEESLFAIEGRSIKIDGDAESAKESLEHILTNLLLFVTTHPHFFEKALEHEK